MAKAKFHSEHFSVVGVTKDKLGHTVVMVESTDGKRQLHFMRRDGMWVLVYSNIRLRRRLYQEAKDLVQPLINRKRWTLA